MPRLTCQKGKERIRQGKKEENAADGKKMKGLAGVYRNFIIYPLTKGVKACIVHLPSKKVGNKVKGNNLNCSFTLKNS